MANTRLRLNAPPDVSAAQASRVRHHHRRGGAARVLRGPLSTMMISVLLLSGLPSLGQQDTKTTAPGEVASSGKQRQMSPNVPAADLAELTAGNARFAFGLYQRFRPQDGNFLYSPYSISQALAMTYAGARNRTEQQMAATLCFSLGQKQLHPAFNALDLELQGRAEGARGQDGRGFRLHIANALWCQEGFHFLGDFLDLLAENYGSGLRLVDFQRDYEESRGIINDWVTDETEGKIKDLFPRGTINRDTRLVLANAIYFNAAWLKQFKEKVTRQDDFHLLDGAKIRVPMMSQTAHFGYAESRGVQAVELLYDGRAMSMVVLLPKAGRFKSFEESLHARGVASILADLNHTKAELTMPKFKYESKFGLNKTLKKMGMPDAFDSCCADFSGMTGKRNLKIDHVVHKAYILVDESGTEAAAATGISVAKITSVQPQEPPVVVKVDRPFVYLIRDVRTGAILFVGRVVDPSK